MATIANPYDPNNPNADQNTGGGGTVMPSTGSTGGAPSGGGGSGSAPSASYSPPNVSQYLAANQGAGQQLSSAIQGNVQNQANQIGQGVSNTQNQLNTQYQPLQQSLNQGQQVAKSAFQDPSQLLADYNAGKTNQYNEFQKLNSGGYNPAIQQYGTTAQQGYNPLQGQLGNINQEASSAANEMGRNQLLQQTVGQPNYSQGQQTLDALFLQGQGNQLRQNLGGIAQSANQNVNQAQSDAQSKLQALQGLSSGNQQYIKNLFGQGLSDIGNNVNSEYTAAQTAAAGVPDLQQRFANNRLSTEDMASLGLTPGEQTYDVFQKSNPDYANLSKMVQATPLAAAGSTAANAQVANPEEFARYNALNQLAGGGNGNTLQSSIFGTATTPSNGTFHPATMNNQFQTDVNNRANYYNKELPTQLIQNFLGNQNSALQSSPLAGQLNALIPQFATPDANSSPGSQIANADKINSIMQQLTKEANAQSSNYFQQNNGQIDPSYQALMNYRDQLANMQNQHLGSLGPMPIRQGQRAKPGL